VYARKWKHQDPDTDIFHRLLESGRTRPAILFLWDQLFEAERECQRIEEYYLAKTKTRRKASGRS
jgi:hypothetical protein